jgi:hypothetical protein
MEQVIAINEQFLAHERCQQLREAFPALPKMPRMGFARGYFTILTRSVSEDGPRSRFGLVRWF